MMVAGAPPRPGSAEGRPVGQTLTCPLYSWPPTGPQCECSPKEHMDKLIYSLLTLKVMSKAPQQNPCESLFLEALSFVNGAELSLD